MKTFEEKLVAMLNPERFRKTTMTDADFESRNPFDNDYYRVITSANVRRLQDKTQVFPQEKSDFVRRRLTHSMEVAAIGRTLGLMVEEKLVERKLVNKIGPYLTQYSRSIATILETAGLVHDIGNPPFGHFGEETIGQYFAKLSTSDVKLREQLLAQKKKISLKSNKKGEQEFFIEFAHIKASLEQETDAIARAFIDFKEDDSRDGKDVGKTDETCALQADFTHFDGNVQGFRILRHLGLSGDDSSFNLTMPTLMSIIKYPFSSVDGNKKEGVHAQEKYGFYQAEKNAYVKICQTLSMKEGQRHPLAYLLEAADDIVNVTSDVEDGFKMGIISIERIKEEINKLNISGLTSSEIENHLKKQRENAAVKLPDVTSELWVKEFRIRAVRHLMTEAVSVFIRNIDAYVNAAYIESDVPTNECLGEELLKNSSLRNCLSILQREIYSKNYILKSELLGYNVITFLLNKFVGCMFSNDIKEGINDCGEKIYTLSTKKESGKLYALISPNYKRAFGCTENQIPAKYYERFLLAVDHVSGMTDSYAVDLYNELNNRKIR